MSDSYQAHLEKVALRQGNLKQLLHESIGAFDSISLEIGCGHGHWLTEFAKTQPSKRFVGIDILGRRVSRSQRKRNLAELNNLYFFKADALETLANLPEKTRISEVFVLFPDPWPKKRHWKNRLINDLFLTNLAERCDTGAKVYFRTDVPDYSEWSSEVIAAHGEWNEIDTFDWPYERPTIFQNRADSHQSQCFVRV